MFLKYLEIQGFKSFPDKVKIDFNIGITGIVGPNGSGKSNISDAIRWVMGEQSARTLRGGKMEDVIFAGTSERKPVGFAEVSICFDNSGGLFKIDYDEVLITRRYFRSGESEYYINKSSCRLKDIHELLMDTGMGRDGYSVIGQGKIDEIVSAKPEDRRIIFEEAAGISKYRYRKAESEKKLQQTSDNLIRILDLISEIEARLEPLKNDSDKAKKYLKLKEELKGIEVSLLLSLIDKIKVDRENAEQNLKTNTLDIEKETSNSQKLENSSNSFAENLKKYEIESEDLLRKSYEVKNKISTLQNDISLLVNSKAHNNENAERIIGEIEKIKINNSELCDKLAIEKNTVSGFETQISELRLKLDEKSNEFSKLDSGIQAANGEYDSIIKNIPELFKKKSDINTEVAAMNAENETLRIQYKSIKEDMEILNEDKTVHLKSIQEGKSKLEVQQKDAEVHSEKLKRSDAVIFDIKNKIEVYKTSVSDIFVNIEKLQSRAKLLSDMERDMEGYAHSVKTVINASKSGVLKNLSVYGTLSKLITMDKKYATAIDAVLGNNLQNIVVQSESDAKSAIEYLKQSKGGRATFLPVEAVRGKKFDESDFKFEKGYISVASDVVRCDTKFSGIVNDALGRTIIFDNIDNAIKFSKKCNQRYKLVTLDGEVFNAGGSITGGNLNKNQTFMSRRVEIDEINSKVSKLKEDKLLIERQLSELQTKLEISEQEYDSVNSENLILKNEIIRTEFNIKHSAELYDSVCAEYKESEEKCRNIDITISSNIEQCNALRIKLTEIDSEIDTLNKTADKLQSANTEKNKRAKELNSEIIRLTLSLSELDNEKNLSEQRIVSFTASIEANSKLIEEKQSEISGTSDRDEEIHRKIEEINTQIENESNKFENYETDLSDTKNKKDKCEAVLADLKEQIKVSSQNLLSLSQEKVRLENKLQKCDSDFDSISTKLWDEYELTYLTAEEFRQDIQNPSAVQKEVNNIRQKIRELGNVNVGAIEEYTVTNDRYTFLNVQKNDLEKAKETLNDVISNMEIMMSKQFVEQIKIINFAFSKIFKEMFGGGEAELIMTDTEDVLNCGIEIHAQPPGKKLQNMTLFSGGEKAIIAISLMFALLEVRPSPVCIFDEVEAALDDVNVNRFAAYLRRICGKSQIAVITHRRGTMEEADVLYGVTMQEKGVSKILKLNIGEIESKVLKK